MRTLIIGGAASGKSEYAESRAVHCPEPRYYIATLMPCDAESLKRIERHHKMRKKKGFFTVERYTDLAKLRLPLRGTALLECLGNLTANEMFTEGSPCDVAATSILSGISSLEAQCNELIVVTNDVSSDGCSYGEGTLRYIEALELLNRKLAARFDRVIEVVCGIPVVLKGNPL